MMALILSVGECTFLKQKREHREGGFGVEIFRAVYQDIKLR
jgi:hypothetical protein